jgi:hypothetical protein
MCDISAHCASGACINDQFGQGFCRTLPLVDGQPCTFDSQCESEFCGLDTNRVCQSLPLANGERCGFNGHCESDICHFGTGGSRCDPGLSVDERCDLAGDPPCGSELFCDPDPEPPACTDVFDAGEACEGSFQCRGSCINVFGRLLCDATPPEDGAVCMAP